GANAAKRHRNIAWGLGPQEMAIQFLSLAAKRRRNEANTATAPPAPPLGLNDQFHRSHARNLGPKAPGCIPQPLRGKRNHPASARMVVLSPQTVANVIPSPTARVVVPIGVSLALAR